MRRIVTRIAWAIFVVWATVSLAFLVMLLVMLFLVIHCLSSLAGYHGPGPHHLADLVNQMAEILPRADNTDGTG